MQFTITFCIEEQGTDLRVNSTVPSSINLNTLLGEKNYAGAQIEMFYILNNRLHYVKYGKLSNSVRNVQEMLRLLTAHEERERGGEQQNNE